MLFKYKAIDSTGSKKEGEIDAGTMDIAINGLQRRGLVVSSIVPADEKPLFERDITFLEHVSIKDIVVVSRQIATLFEAQVSALRIFQLLGEESEKGKLRKVFSGISDDLQGGSSISSALEKHPDIFNPFYTNMVKTGEEAGRLDETFNYLADYLDRNYEVTSKARNALIYPAFVIFTFVAVMMAMLTLVIPRLSQILLESGQEIPIYTTAIIKLSDFFVNYWLLVIAAFIGGVVLLWQYWKSEEGKRVISDFQIKVPYVGDLFRKLYLSRIADNFNTMLASGIPMVRTIELTAKVVDNKLYEIALMQVAEDVRSGSPLSTAMSQQDMIPNIMSQMIKVGEEAGDIGKILKTLANFYRREVNNAVDTLVGMIEPIMIVLLGLGVGTLLAAILMPIYNIAGSF